MNLSTRPSESSSAIVSPFASGLLWIKDYKGNTMAFPLCGGNARRQGELALPTNTPEEPKNIINCNNI